MFLTATAAAKRW